MIAKITLVIRCTLIATPLPNKQNLIGLSYLLKAEIKIDQLKIGLLQSSTNHEAVFNNYDYQECFTFDYSLITRLVHRVE